MRVTQIISLIGTLIDQKKNTTARVYCCIICSNGFWPCVFDKEVGLHQCWRREERGRLQFRGHHGYNGSLINCNFSATAGGWFPSEILNIPWHYGRHVNKRAQKYSFEKLLYSNCAKQKHSNNYGQLYQVIDGKGGLWAPNTHLFTKSNSSSKFSKSVLFLGRGEMCWLKRLDLCQRHSRSHPLSMA